MPPRGRPPKPRAPAPSSTQPAASTNTSSVSSQNPSSTKRLPATQPNPLPATQPNPPLPATQPKPLPATQPNPLPATQPSLPDADDDDETQDRSLTNAPDQTHAPAQTPLTAAQKKLTCRWTDLDDQLLVSTLMDKRALHSGTTTGFKPVSWKACATALIGSETSTASKAKDSGACKSRWHTLKKLYLSFKTVSLKLGAGWDKTTQMISLPPQGWRELEANTLAAGRELSRWKTRPFPLYHDLAALVEGNVATGDHMESTADVGPAKTPSTAAMMVPPLDGEDNDNDDNHDDDETLPKAPSVTQSIPQYTPTPAKRKRAPTMTPDILLKELKGMTSTVAGAMNAPISIPPIVFAPPPATTSVYMQAISLVQKEEGLSSQQIFDAIDFFNNPNHAEVYISLNDTLRPTWLRMKLGWVP